MSEQFVRKPLGNFFIKRSLQLRLMFKIVFAVLFATIISSGSLLLVYYLKYKSVLLYQMDQMTNLTKENIIFIVLPSLLMSALVNFLLAMGIGLYASRKYAVPIYKLEHWARLLKEGKITAKIRFREKEEMKELTDYCNDLSVDLLQKLLEIKKQVGLLQNFENGSEQLTKIREVLATFELDAETIEIFTSHYNVSDFREKAPPAAPESC
jgi:methyl-accepting chemotaxis protein